MLETHQNDTSSKFGMWLFLLSEILLFGGLFILYSVYRYQNPQLFHLAADALNRPLGTLNTLILLTSSLTMVLSILFLKKRNPGKTLLFLASTLFLGLFFLFIKYLEWTSKVHHGIYPNATRLLERERGEILFYGLYYSMTGLHGLHVLVGLCLLSVMFIFILKKKIDHNYVVPLENTGLYWHLVDIVWIFLFPLFYLIT
ncbi:MAG: cytochrome c oxidase subunit 3 family protein [Deltaproteobacteria bacterium]|nr:cytochrome c oxidase subunit 3 family protein [Deltaproteobacteria bacterium]